MDTFAKLFGSLVVFVYHCFNRMVILGHLPLLTRPEHIVHFFRDVHGTYPITKEALRQRTDDYHRWVDAFARKQSIPVEWAQKGVRKEDYVRPALHRMEGPAAVRGVLHPEEHGGGAELPHQYSQVPHGGPGLPSHRATAWAIHALLLLHPRRRAGPDVVVCGVLPAVPHHVLPQRPSLHRADVTLDTALRYTRGAVSDNVQGVVDAMNTKE